MDSCTELKNYSVQIDLSKSNVVTSIVTHTLSYELQISYKYTNLHGSSSANPFVGTKIKTN